jgi:hypothetical protein
MASQAEPSERIEQEFFEDVGESQSESEGSLRTGNRDGNKWEREWGSPLSNPSKYRRTLRMILCVHGWDSVRHEQAMSLIVMKIHLAVHSTTGKFKSSRLWPRFDDHAEKNHPFPVEATR